MKNIIDIRTTSKYDKDENTNFHFKGQFLTQKILENQTDLELAFVWNRSKEVLNSSNVPKELILENLEDCFTRHPDLIVEVAHPIIVEKV